MSGCIDRSSLVGTWRQVDSAWAVVMVFAGDGRCDMEIPTPDLAGSAMSFRELAGDWVLEDERLRLTFRTGSANAWTEGEIEYVVVECGERLGLRGAEDVAGEVDYLERVDRT